MMADDLIIFPYETMVKSYFKYFFEEFYRIDIVANVNGT